MTVTVVTVLNRDTDPSMVIATMLLSFIALIKLVTEDREMLK
jgi:hypothetical protein